MKRTEVQTRGCEKCEEIGRERDGENRIKFVENHIRQSYIHGSLPLKQELDLRLNKGEEIDISQFKCHSENSLLIYH